MEIILEDSLGILPENKLVWISPERELLFTYHKAKKK